VSPSLDALVPAVGNARGIHAAGGVIVRALGRSDYDSCWRAMREFTQARQADTEDEIWLTEHAPIYTLGLAGPSGRIEREGQRPSAASDMLTAATITVDRDYFHVLGFSLGLVYSTPNGDCLKQAFPLGTSPCTLSPTAPVDTRFNICADQGTTQDEPAAFKRALGCR